MKSGVGMFSLRADKTFRKTAGIGKCGIRTWIGNQGLGGTVAVERRELLGNDFLRSSMGRNMKTSLLMACVAF